MFRCIFAVTWYEYCCPDTMLAEKRRRTTTCKKMFVRTIPHLARYGHYMRKNNVTMQTVSWLNCLHLVGKNTLDSDPPMPSPSK